MGNITNLRKQSGLSLVELLIALTIGLLLLTGLTLIFVNSSEANRELQKTAQQIENGRYAIDILSQDLRHAGFYGHYTDLPASPAGLPDPCDTNTGNLLAAVPLAVQGYRAPALNAIPDVTASTCDDALLTAANLQPGSDVLVVRRAHTKAVATTESTVSNEVYIQATRNLAEIRLGNGAVLGNNRPNGTPSSTAPALLTNNGNPAPVRKYHVHIYFVAPCSVGSGANGICTAADDTIPTLKRIELTAGPALRIVPLVEGIEYLKIEYGVDALDGKSPPTTDPSLVTLLPGDSTVDSYTADPGTPAAWSSAIAAKVYVLARNTDPTAGFTDDKTYALGSVAPMAVGPTMDRFRRHVYTAAVRVMNPSGRREIPEIP